MTFSAVRLLGGSFVANGRRSMLSGPLGGSVRVLSSSSPADPPADSPVDAPAASLDDIKIPVVSSDDIKESNKTSSFVLDLQAGAVERANEMSAKGIPAGPIASNFTSKRGAKPLELKKPVFSSKREAKPEAKPASSFASKRDAKPTASKDDVKPSGMSASKRGPALASKRTPKEGVKPSSSKPVSFSSTRVAKSDAPADLGNASTPTKETDVPSELGSPSTPTKETDVPSELGSPSATVAEPSKAPVARMQSRRLAVPPPGDRSDDRERSAVKASSGESKPAPSARKPAVKFTARRGVVGTIGSSLPERKKKPSASSQIIEEDGPSDPRAKAKEWESRREAKEKAQASADEDKASAGKGAVTRTETRRVPQTEGRGGGGGGGRSGGGGRGGGGGGGRSGGGRGAKPESQEDRLKEFAQRFVEGTGNQPIPVQMLMCPLQLRQDLFNKHQLDPVANSFTRLAQAYRMRPEKVAGIIRLVGMEKDHEAETGVLDYSSDIAAREIFGESWVQYTQSREEDLARRHSKIRYTTYADDEQTPDERAEQRKTRDAERKIKWLKKQVNLASDIARDAATSKGLSASEIKEAGNAAGEARSEEIKLDEQAAAERRKTSESNLGGRPDVSDTPWGGPTSDAGVTALDDELYKRFWNPIIPPTHVIKEVGKYVYRDVSLETVVKHSHMKNQGIVNLSQIKKAARA